ncbi:hypothetical protein CDQ84_04805 [Clostridium thermosuccinogenes]|jgi:acid phosphatase family membrane protein YuiD|uniref:Acid phosphatase n=1 Tax=Clostridium thermosuccinogenes TaxID=84032 RepID=A0A2K2FIY5_9CLOT|nr:divergent PAP2 family protein [Pseudoclostridium thermosuccinogenes]AUS96172.1 hypothetical protein CDO33_06815 [Pseudoclostridium thermosuccinogenes]PNT93145.1 hypothetical protein CDQ83_06330 [Pseudoclostridium thermosuccinogenes]PNT98752.1 hypothetical protein CDQ85_04760 [Pseudoclostridium thermosuccinogenes]PNU00751.1 hypothetical protein CDQ84_04805 [Pseudoclostridium thermosuccinogenes]
MQILVEIFSNRAIIIPALAWFIAQALKVVSVVIHDRKLDFTRFIGSGGMPSSHSAFIVSLSAVVGKNLGFDSMEFGMSVAIALIVMYDAAGVRRAAGKHAKVLNKLTRVISGQEKMQFDEELKELLGHTPLEVIMGALLGVIMGLWFG